MLGACANSSWVCVVLINQNVPVNFLALITRCLCIFRFSIRPKGSAGRSMCRNWMWDQMKQEAVMKSNTNHNISVRLLHRKMKVHFKWVQSPNTSHRWKGSCSRQTFSLHFAFYLDSKLLHLQVTSMFNKLYRVLSFLVHKHSCLLLRLGSVLERACWGWNPRTVILVQGLK